ncbi:MAG: RNase adapter RapZ [Vampirovibrionales bacterium]|nr:RNase adapter RapZ [Vampirovibrionales bacterium]
MLPQVLLVTGPPGGGVSSVMPVLARQGVLCVQNLTPAKTVTLITALLKSITLAEQPLALSFLPLPMLADAQATRAYCEQILATAEAIKVIVPNTELIRVSAALDTRRAYLPKQPNLDDALIAAQSAIFTDVFADARFKLNVQHESELSATIARILARPPAALPGPFEVCVMSFGFKHGLPPEADLVLDARFIPNPFYTPALAPQTGLDTPVAEFIASQPQTDAVITPWLALLEPWLLAYALQGKRRAVVAIGCTGGRHRSVYVAERVASWLKEHAKTWAWSFEPSELLIKTLHREQVHWGLLA